MKKLSTFTAVTVLVVVIVLILAACAPAITDVSAPIAVPPADHTAVVPVTGNSAPETARSESQAPRLWSGEVFLSDNDAPDSQLNTNNGTEQDLQQACISEDDSPRRYGGCAE